MSYSSNQDELLNSFVEYLRAEAPQKAKAFDDQIGASREAALAEAAVFGILRQLDLRPKMEDLLAIPTADFMCTYRPLRFADRDSWPLVVEATTLEPSAVERNTQWRGARNNEVVGGAFGMITERIVNRISDKIPQLSTYEMPRVLAIASSHDGADAFLSSTLVAESLLTLDPTITQRVGGDLPRKITGLSASAFLRLDPHTGVTTAKRQTVSAVLLLGIAGDSTSVVGILHPEARYPLDIAAFPSIPFVRVSTWPPENGRRSLDWVVGQPSPTDFKHRPIASGHN